MVLAMPIQKPNLPSVIKAQPNGAIDRSLLEVVDKAGLTWEMASYAARGMRAWHAAAKSKGFDIRSTGRGRTLAQQWQIFGGSQARYRPVSIAEFNAAPSANRKHWPINDYTSGQGLPAPGRRSVAQILNITIPDSNYWIKIGPPYPATAAVPGTSNHGFWCADDMQEFVNGVGLNSIRVTTLQWLYATAARFGFAWELVSENWHVHWVSGDVIPPDVLAYENGSAPPVPTPIPPTPSPEPPSPDYDDDEMPIVTNAEQLFDNKPLEAKFVVRDDGTIRHIGTLAEWNARGSKVGTPLSNVDIGVLWKE